MSTIDDDGGIRNSSASKDAQGRVRHDPTKKSMDPEDIQAMIEADVKVIDADKTETSAFPNKRRIEN